MYEISNNMMIGILKKEKSLVITNKKTESDKINKRYKIDFCFCSYSFRS